LQHEKIRIYILARELDMESKSLLELCQQHGIDVKNQLSSLDPEQRDMIVALVRSKGSRSASAPKPAGPLPSPVQPVRNLPPSKPPVLTRPPRPDAVPPAPAAPAAPASPVPTPESPITAVPPAPLTPAAKITEPPAHKPETPPPPAAPRAPETPARPAETRPAARAPNHAPPLAPTPKGPPPPPTGPAPRPPIGGVPSLGGGRMRTLSAPRPGPAAGRPGDRGRTPPRPSSGGSIRVTPPPGPSLRPKPPDKKEPPKPAGPVKLAEIPEEFTRREGPVSIQDITRVINQQQLPAGKAAVSIGPEDLEEDDDGKKGGVKKKPGVVLGRDARHKERSARQEQRKSKAELDVRSSRLASTLLEDEPRSRRSIERIKKRQKAGPQPRKGKVPIDVPITVRSLSEAIGVKNATLIAKLMAQGLMYTINSTLEPDVAETLALDHGCELDVKRKQDAEVDLLASYRTPDDPDALQSRAPVVTIMGHVDHGKTSLLDKIRKSNVVATEAGGITQVIRAWRVEHGGKPITFLDTPGHEAFTKMRARGANVTDIAVIVVAADDGVMPQTEEAISHAKAAGVSIVVAINKIDMPSANIRKTEQQLYGLGLVPDNMGGEVPFVQTSAATGKGIDDLLDTLSLVAEVKELKANPNKHASGVCLEAYKSEEEGVFATLLIREGTLRRGDVALCGATYGRVRAMYDDLGRQIEEAGPTVPVRISGLDEVPNADDPFMVVPGLAEAREIADRRKSRAQEAALFKRAPVSLENLSDVKIDELKVILKAEARGSIEAIRKELEKLRHDEVRVRVLHAAIGGITESDVQLALTSPEDTLILGFNVVPDDRALALAEERGIKIREYDIIYKLTDDVRSALEGKLKPREEVIHLGRAMVRETFKISRVGTIAGCYVTQGTIERSAKVRVIRSGVVIFPPTDRTAGLDSLKRFKEDVKEVREGFECGIKVAGYDDVKVDDVIEAYRIEQVQRTLS
jgi:translation initiation factor IF-2